MIKSKFPKRANSTTKSGDFIQLIDKKNKQNEIENIFLHDQLLPNR